MTTASFEGPATPGLEGECRAGRLVRPSAGIRHKACSPGGVQPRAANGFFGEDGDDM